MPVSGDEAIGDGLAVVDDLFVDVGSPAPVQDAEGASPDVDPFESDGEGEDVGLVPETVLGESGAVPPVPVPSPAFVRPPREKMKVKRKLLPQSSAASIPDVLYEQGGHKQQQSEMNLVSEWNPCFDEHGNVRYFWDEDVGAHDVQVHDLR